MATPDIKPTERQKQPGQLNQEQKDPFDPRSKKQQSVLQPVAGSRVISRA